VTNVLEGVITGGTGTPASIGCYDGMAGKTGTSEDLSDAWFVGYTPEYSTAVWTGHPNSREYTGFGGPTSGPIWQHYMSEAQNGNCPTFQVPSVLPDLSPFFSDLTSSAPSSRDTSTTAVPTDSTTSTTDTTDTNGGSNDAQQCDPSVYNCDGGGFQTQPTTPTPPPVPPGNGGGNGEGGGPGGGGNGGGGIGPG
jgi:penicillin-binding protein 1A